ncbi:MULTISPECIES: avidin/streptavidin family protein [Streptomyces]|uniref:avidin/streptavidin family protein n=1 Tax=Streptomyces TaxID=1883 RepID=UPI00201CBB66|nr:avidin/streptavidin family protein [Streptomyces panaciradicis]MCL6670152.1 avidin/streptavidin family protein [Streptomyces panaciradicis]
MSISGDWYNEIGSHMRITTDPAGNVKGTYVSAAGHAIGTYPLVGRCEAAADPEHGTPLGWTVAWRNGRTDAGSVTSWSGQYYDDGDERICATWLLTASAAAANTWEATAVGQDVFTRESPSPEQAEQRLRHVGAASHPRPVNLDEVTPV